MEADERAGARPGDGRYLMNDINGGERCAAIKQNMPTAGIPVVIIAYERCYGYWAIVAATLLWPSRWIFPIYLKA